MAAEILPAAEAADLAEHEAVIERGMTTFVEVGNSLAAIREQRLYRGTHGRFEDYCQERWGFNRHRASQLITASDVVTTVTSSGLPTPTTERQARELARVPEPDRADVWAATVERTEGKPTAAAVRETYQQRQQDEPEPNTWTPAETTAQPAPKRRPLTDAFATAVIDLTRAAERLERLTADDRFARNLDATRRHTPELLGALERTADLIGSLDLPAAEANEEARRWWATSLNKISSALTGAAQSIDQEK